MFSAGIAHLWVIKIFLRSSFFCLLWIPILNQSHLFRGREGWGSYDEPPAAKDHLARPQSNMPLPHRVTHGRLLGTSQLLVQTKHFFMLQQHNIVTGWNCAHNTWHDLHTNLKILQSTSIFFTIVYLIKQEQQNSLHLLKNPRSHWSVAISAG